MTARLEAALRIQRDIDQDVIAAERRLNPVVSGNDDAGKAIRAAAKAELEILSRLTKVVQRIIEKERGQ